MLSRPTFANILNDSGGKARRRAPKCVLFATGLIEFLLSSIVFTYPAFFRNISEYTYIYDDYPSKDNLWPIIAHVACCLISASLTRCLCEYYETETSRLHLFFGAILLYISLIIQIFEDNIPLKIASYGASGLVAGYIRTYIQYTLEEDYDVLPNVISGINQLARALCLTIAPSITNLVYEVYLIKAAWLYYSTFMLNVASLVLIFKSTLEKQPNINRYQDVNRIPVPLEDMGQISNRSSLSSDDEEDGPPSPDVDVMWHEETLAQYGNTIQDYYSSVMGVNIMPRIREESEGDSEDLNQISSKRLSQITARLEMLNQNQINTINNSVDIFSNIDAEPNRAPSVEFYEINKGCCSPYHTYLWKRRWRRFVEFFSYNFASPLYKALTSLYFYITLVSKSVNLVVTTCFLVLVPVIAHTSPKEDNFLLTYAGFTWNFFLLSLPVLIGLPTISVRILNIMGNIVLVAGFIVSSTDHSHNKLVICCMCFGCGYGITNYTETIVFRDFLGTHRWRDTKGCLATLSAALVLVLFELIDYFSLPYDYLLEYSMYIYMANACLWIVAPLTKSSIKFTSKMIRHRREEDLFT